MWHWPSCSQCQASNGSCFDLTFEEGATKMGERKGQGEIAGSLPSCHHHHRYLCLTHLPQLALPWALLAAVPPGPPQAVWWAPLAAVPEHNNNKNNNNKNKNNNNKRE